MGGLSIWHWLILLVVLGVLFGGTKKFRNIGEDLGSAVKSFRKGLADAGDDKSQLKADAPAQGAPGAEAKSEQAK